MQFITINKKKLTIPTSWSEVIFRDYLRYTDLKNAKRVDVVALFTGIKKDVWENSKEIHGFYIIANALEFLNKDPKVDSITNPGAVTITQKEKDKDGKEIEITEKYLVPQKLEQYTVKQFEDMRGLVRRHQKDKKQITVKLYPQIISIYFCTLIFDEYSVKNLKKTNPLIEDLTMFEVIGIGNFFLKSSTELLSGTKPGRQRLTMIMKRLRQAFTR